MKQLKTSLGVLAITTCLSTSASGEGLERATFSTDYLYTSGNFVEFTYGRITPSINVTNNITGNTGNDSVAEPFSAATTRLKLQFDDQFALGLSITNAANGVDLDYSQSGLPNVTVPIAHIDSTEIQALAKYQFNQNISVFGGAKVVSASGDLNLGAPLVMARDQGTGFIAGASYEIPEFALRATLSYESAIDLTLSTTVGGVLPAGNTTASIGDAYQLEFQSGIAQNTLVFGKIRRANWA